MSLAAQQNYAQIDIYIYIYVYMILQNMCSADVIFRVTLRVFGGKSFSKQKKVFAIIV